MKPHAETYRGALVYRQEKGYALITITVRVREQETSQVESFYSPDQPITEEAEHLPGIDVYCFAVPYDSRIRLAIMSETDKEEAWYKVTGEDVVAETSPLFLHVIRSSESRPMPRTSQVGAKFAGVRGAVQ